MAAIVNQPLQAGGSRASRRVVVLGAVAAVAAFVAGPVLFVPAAGLPTPTGAQVPLFIALAVIEAVIFGAGVVVAIAGRRVVARLFSTAGRTTAVHLAVTWALISWWPHDGLHMATGVNINGLLGIEYGFHVTLMIAAAVVVVAFAREARAPQA